MEKVLTRHIGTPNLWKLETYRSLGGYQTLEKALREYQPDDIVTMVRDCRPAWPRRRRLSHGGEVGLFAEG